MHVDCPQYLTLAEDGKIWWTLEEAINLVAGHRPDADDRADPSPGIRALVQTVAKAQTQNDGFSDGPDGIPWLRVFDRNGTLFVRASEFLAWLAQYICLSQSEIAYPTELARAVRTAIAAKPLRTPMEGPFESLTAALDGWFAQPLADLPEELRNRVERDCSFLHSLWDVVTPDARRQAALDWDCENDPANAAAREHLWGLWIEHEDVARQIAELDLTAPHDVSETIQKEDRLIQLRLRLAELEAQVNGDEPTAAHEEKARKRKLGRKRSEAPARLAEILDALEEFARTAGQEFDRKAMPGPLGNDWKDEDSFHWLCASWFREFRCSKSNFEKQRAGICAIQPYAKQSDFYRLAAPRIAPKFSDVTHLNTVPKRTRKSA
jgi:hypothetical protein